VVVFRPAGDAVDVVRQAITIGAPAVWLQSGIFSAELGGWPPKPGWITSKTGAWRSSALSDS
jgi:hypothetical protein